MNIVRPVMLIMVVANVLNVIVCAIFIAWLRLGIEGAAIAMLLNSLSPPVLCLVYIWKSGVFAGAPSRRKGIVCTVRTVLTGPTAFTCTAGRLSVQTCGTAGQPRRSWTGAPLSAWPFRAWSW